MSDFSLIQRFFPQLSKTQVAQLEALVALVRDYNQKVNLVSRKREEWILEDHVLPSLALTKVITFANNSAIMDVGTGGGFPGLPLAIAHPNCQFLLVDSIGKKIDAVNYFVRSLGLKNVKTHHGRVEKIQRTFDFVVARAVTALPDFLALVKNKVHRGHQSSLSNGVLYLKGGDFTAEIEKISHPVTCWPMAGLFENGIAADKCIVFVDVLKRN